MRLLEQDSRWTLVYAGSQVLHGNCLDVIHFPERGIVAVSVDTVHEPGSYKTFRANEISTALQFFQINQATPSLSPDDVLDVSLDHIPADKVLATAKPAVEVESKGKTWEKIFTPLGELIYGLENLRKRRGRAAEEEDEDGEAEEMPEIDDSSMAPGPEEGS